MKFWLFFLLSAGIHCTVFLALPASQSYPEVHSYYVNLIYEEQVQTASQFESFQATASLKKKQVTPQKMQVNVAQQCEIKQENKRVQKKKKFQIPMSDEPGVYNPEVLSKLLQEYLSRQRVTNQRLRDVLLPALLKHKTLTRHQLKEELLKYDPSLDASKIGLHLTTMSSQMGMKKNDFLRQIVGYEYPTYAWEKDNYCIRSEYRELVREILDGLGVRN